MFGVLESCGQQDSIISFHIISVKQTALLQFAQSILLVDPAWCSEVRAESRSRWEQENAAESEMAGWTDGEMIAMTVRFLTLSQ